MTRPHHRPALPGARHFEALTGGTDPAEAREAADRLATLLVRGRRGVEDEAVVARVVALAEDEGLEVLADLWAGSPADSLAGALWRLYLLHEWVQRTPEEVGRLFSAGVGHAEVYGAIVGVQQPPDPQALRRLTEEILTGIFSGDLAIALERAGAFCQVMAVGLVEPGVEDIPPEQSRRAARMRDTADDLVACARLWRKGDLH